MSFAKMSLDKLAARLAGREELAPDEIELLKADRRRGAQRLLEQYLKRRQARRAELARLHTMLAEERLLWERGIERVAGVDEAGRGPLAGPVVAAAVILAPGTLIIGLNDSKQLAPEAREKLYGQIMREARGVGIGIGSVEEIDRINIYGALMQAMRGALAALTPPPETVLVDGFPIRDLALPQKAIKGGDALSLSIAAASVVAKVTRDRIMLELHERYPAYRFDRNKGYATREHRIALARHGPSPVHRRSFRLISEDSGGVQN